MAITVEYSQNAFDEEVELVVEDVKEAREPGAIYVIGNEKREQVGCLNIKMVSATTNEPVQPNNRVVVKMEIPEEFIGQNEFRIVHTYNDKTRRGLSTSASNKDNLIKISPDGKFLIFSVPHFSEFEVSAVIPNNPATITINNNIGAATIKYGETLRLTAKAGNLPKDAEICWYVNGEKMASGETFDVNLQGGTYEIVVKLVGKDGNVLKDDSGHEISDSEKVTVKSNLWLRIIAFFKNLFGKKSIIVQSLYVIK